MKTHTKTPPIDVRERETLFFFSNTHECAYHSLSERHYCAFNMQKKNIQKNINYGRNSLLQTTNQIFNTKRKRTVPHLAGELWTYKNPIYSTGYMGTVTHSYIAADMHLAWARTSCCWLTTSPWTKIYFQTKKLTKKLKLKRLKIEVNLALGLHHLTKKA